MSAVLPPPAMTLDAKRLLAWQTLACRTPGCAQPAGRRCVNILTRQRTNPHPRRMEDIDVWLSRQPEVDDLTARLQASQDANRILASQNTTLRADRDLANLNLMNANAAVTRLNAAVDELSTSLAAEKDARTSEVRTLTDRVAIEQQNVRILNEKLRLSQVDLTHANEDLDTLIQKSNEQAAEIERLNLLLNPPPLVTRTLFGGCPAAGGETLAAQEEPFRHYGGPVTVRQFFSTGVAPRAAKTKVIRLHASWNLGSMTLEDMTLTWVQGVVQRLLAGDRVEVIHEADKKVTDGKRTYEECIAFKNKFYELVKQVRPDLFVVNTLTGGSLSNYGGNAEERWGAVKADLLGVDCDGVHDNVAPLNIDYKDEVAGAVAFVKKYADMGYKGIIAPEFGTSRPTYDTDGKLRGAWITKNVGYMIDAKFLEVNAYEYDSTPGNKFADGSPEHAAFQAFVRTNVAS